MARVVVWVGGSGAGGWGGGFYHYPVTKTHGQMFWGFGADKDAGIMLLPSDRSFGDVNPLSIILQK